jgi:colanic acid/amylovoran biosynthesis glycosyltransferase
MEISLNRSESCRVKTSDLKKQDKPRVLIFRNEVLPVSETFIAAQANALRVTEPHYAGVHVARRSLQLESSPTLLDPSSTVVGKLRRRIYWRWGFAPEFIRRLDVLQPDLIHAHFAVDAAAALPVAKRLQIPLVVTLHGYDVTSSDEALNKSPEGRLYLRQRRQVWERASSFLCISKFIHDHAIAKGFPRDKLRLQYTGVDLSLFRSPNIKHDPNLILFVGRLVEKKGCSYLLEALELVRRKHPGAKLICIGGGPLRDELRASADAARLPCQFIGSQAAPVVKQYLARARIFCVPSVQAESGDSEGLGMVFVEAQAMGVPVVSFAHGGIPEVVIDGETGLLAPERDVPELANHLLRLLQDEQYWARLSENGRKWVHRAFDLHVQTRQLERVYGEVLLGYKGSVDRRVSR